ncbi:MAG TPA: transposase [Epulopiscium sp.]|nr:transposase [Candidatus Epulonipiscium sp.]
MFISLPFIFYFCLLKLYSNREKKDKKNIRKWNKVKKDFDKVWANINVYITNIPPKMVDTDHIHLLYTLRWQIENMFKIWKSTFKIAAVKKVKLERFQCFLYGRLIELVLTASVVSTSKAIAMLKGIKPLSEKKTFDITKEFLEHLTAANCKNKKTLLNFLTRLIQIILKRGGKNEKKGSTSYADIFKFLGYNPRIGGDMIS